MKAFNLTHLVAKGDVWAGGAFRPACEKAPTQRSPKSHVGTPTYRAAACGFWVRAEARAGRLARLATGAVTEGVDLHSAARSLCEVHPVLVRGQFASFAEVERRCCTERLYTAGAATLPYSVDEAPGQNAFGVLQMQSLTPPSPLAGTEPHAPRSDQANRSSSKKARWVGLVTPAATGQPMTRLYC